MVGQVVTEPYEHKSDHISFKLCDPNGLYFQCVAPFQLAHHVRQHDMITCYAEIEYNKNNEVFLFLETIHEHIEPDPEPFVFELGGAL